MLVRLSLSVRIFLFFVALAIGTLLALALVLWFGLPNGSNPEALNGLLRGAIVAGFVLLGLFAWFWYLFDINMAKPIEGLAGAIRARTHAHVEDELDKSQAKYLGDLADAASAAAAPLAQARNAATESVARETARLSGDKSKLEELLADVPPGVLLCTSRHRIVFYNGAAHRLLSTEKIPLCLDRNLFDFIKDGPVRQAHHRLLDGDTSDTAEMLCTTPDGSRRLAVRMRLVGSSSDDRAAYALTLRDVTTELAGHARRDALLSDVFERVAPTVEALAQTAAKEQGTGPDLIRQEIDALRAMMVQLEERFETCRSDGWPMAFIASHDLLRDITKRLEATGLAVKVASERLALRCNAFDITALIGHLVDNIQAKQPLDHVSLVIEQRNGGAAILLRWQGSAPDPETLESWLHASLDASQAGLSGHAILKNHAASLSSRSENAGAELCLSIRQAERRDEVVAESNRFVVHDFELLARAHYEKISDARLDDLTFVVFDTETTGLLPEQGDEIVQLAAVRVVNGRRIQTEVFDCLVNPGRRIPPSSTAVHGVSDDMVADAPGVLDVLERFHRFAEGAVLVAHNAPFDMEFLKRRERELGLYFDHPILDTVLLSAVVFGQSETHSLDALTRRLGIHIPEGARHTALGDTIATADALIKLKAMLEAKGHDRFGEVLTEVRRHRRLLKDLNTA